MEGGSGEGERGGKQWQGGGRAEKAKGLRGTSKAGWIGFGNEGIGCMSREKGKVTDDARFLTWVTRWVVPLLGLKSRQLNGRR